jgi:hypothetical protein
MRNLTGVLTVIAVAVTLAIPAGALANLSHQHPRHGCKDGLSHRDGPGCGQKDGLSHRRP